MAIRQQEKVQIIWAASFVISGIILGLSIWLIPVIGAFTVASFIVVYVGISAAFLLTFREIEGVKPGTIENLKERHRELAEMKKAIEQKYYRRKIDAESFRIINRDYEKQMTEIEVRLKRLGRK
jgi:hypothetical protein